MDGAEDDEQEERDDDDIDEEDEEAEEADVLHFNPSDEIIPVLKLSWKKILDLVRNFISYFKPYPLRRDILRGAYNEILKEKEKAKKDKARAVQMPKERIKARMQLLRNSTARG